MASPKSAKNAAEAAGKKVPTKPGSALVKKNPEYWRRRGDELGIDAVAAKKFDEELVPQIQAAGYPNSVIDGFVKSPNPFEAATQFIGAERADLVDQLVALNAGFTPQGLEKTPLRELWSTFEDASKPAQDRASNIRGQVDEPTVTESRLPGENTATANAELGETPKTEAAPAAPKAESGPPNAKDRKRLKWEERQRSAANAETARGGNWAEVDWKGSNRDSGYAGRTAAGGDWSRLKAEDYTGEGKLANPSIQGNQASAPQPRGGGGSPPPPPPGGGGPPGDPPGPTLADTDPLLYRGKQAIGAGGWVAKNAWPTAIATATGAYGLARSLGWGSGQPAATSGQQQQSPAGGGPRIQILPRSDLRNREAPARPAPPPMQQPAMPPQQAVPGRDQSTDIIRQLSGRMA